MRGTTKILATMVLAAGTIFASPASAEDVIRLKDGTELRGEIQNELDGFVWIKRSIGEISRVEVFGPDDIDEIIRDADDDAAGSTAGSENSNAAATSTAATRAAPSEITLNHGTPRGAVITLEGTVGMQMAAKALRDIIPTLERELGTDGSGIVVLKINSGGGLTLEVSRLNDIIQNEYKPRFRTVAWIESAISAAAMTSHVLEEIYFMPEGHYGACTEFNGGSGVATRGIPLEMRLHQMERTSALGGHDYRLMRSMQITDPLSYTIDESGQVTFYQTTDGGNHVLNRPTEILTLTEDQATAVGFSSGTAATLKELQQAMCLPEVEWVGRHVPTELFPISDAEREMQQFRAKVSDDEARTREYFTNYQTSVGVARSAPNEDIRGRFVGLARRHLQSIIGMVKNNPNFALMVLGTTEDGFDEWVQEQEEMLSDIAAGR